MSTATINAQEIEVSATAGFESEYIFRGVQIADESIQASIEGTYGDGYFGLWANESIEDYDRNASEYDLYAGWGYAIDDTFTADFGATVYYYPDAEGDDSTFEAYAGISADVELAPSLYVYYDFDLEVLTLEASVSKSYKVDEKSSIELGAGIGYAEEDSSDFSYAYYSFNADYVYTFQDNLTASIGVRASGNDLDEVYTVKGDNIWGGVSFSYGF
ncbi:hypothetical protein VDG1235_2531 [Verrucomicrobiia bacterium DG1235]|nr:hypothetical protein VDG1235_2531 [Verrucomicrobiae bacterium DG1235]